MKKKVPKDWIKISEFEKLTGLNANTITAAIKRGAIPDSCVDRVGTTATAPYYLHPQKSALAWHDNLSINHPLSRKVKETLAKYIRKAYPRGLDEDKPSKAKGKAKPMSLADAQLREQVAKAKLRELELQEKEGSLVQRAMIDDQLFALGQELRNALLAIPDRVINHIIAAADNRTIAHNLLYDAIASELEKLTDINNRLSQ